MAAADETLAEASLLFGRLGDARGCLHIADDGTVTTHVAGLKNAEGLCVEAPDFSVAVGELRDLVEQTIARADALTDAVEQLHTAAHPGVSLALCSAEPCSGLRRHIPNARGVLPT